jgi:site-specific recombinase XerD
MSAPACAATPVGALLQSFFAEHLPSHRHASQQTMDGYRDTFRLLLKFLRHKIGKEPSRLQMTDLDAPAILAFLDHLEADRKNSIRSRNVRLAAIRTFFRFVALRDPASVHLVTRALAIPVKRADRQLVSYQSRPEMDAILAAPDQKQWTGQRDYLLLLTLYNTGGRVSEVTALRRNQIYFGSTSFVQFHGKGRKERSVPLWPRSARALKTWFETSNCTPETPAFPNARGGRLSRDGVDYILREAVGQASQTCPSLATKRVSPHVIRHTTAMHLLQAGVDIAVIALWLGHESIETTHGYLEADLKLKEQALQKVAPAGQGFQRFRPSDPLLAFLTSL